MFSYQEQSFISSQKRKN